MKTRSTNGTGKLGEISQYKTECTEVSQSLSLPIIVQAQLPIAVMNEARSTKGLR